MRHPPGQGDTVGEQQIRDKTIAFEGRRETHVPQAALAQDDQAQQLRQDDIGDDADERRHQAFAVTKQQIPVGQRAAPAHLLPTLQPDAQGPARFLAERGAEGVREQFAHAQRHFQGRLVRLAEP
ncbi:hypothetical protein D3C85_1130980 [compost metagenome]